MENRVLRCCTILVNPRLRTWSVRIAWGLFQLTDDPLVVVELVIDHLDTHIKLTDETVQVEFGLGHFCLFYLTWLICKTRFKLDTDGQNIA